MNEIPKKINDSSDDWRFPIPKNHVYAICVMLTISLITAIFLPAPTELSKRDKYAWSSTGRVPDNHQDLRGITYIEDLNATESIDSDPIPDSELFDTDSDSDSASSDWYVQTVVSGDNINNIFLTINQPYEILKAIEKVPNYGVSIKSIHPGDKIFFLLDSKNQLLQLVKPYDKDEQIRYVRSSPDSLEFTAIKEPVDAHIDNTEDTELKSVEDIQIAENEDTEKQTEEVTEAEEKKQELAKKQKAEAEKKKQELAEKQKAEAEKKKQELAEKQKAEAEKKKQELAEKKKAEAEKKKQELAEKKKAEEERIKKEQLALAKAKAEKEAKLKAEAERLKKENEPLIAVRKTMMVVNIQKGDNINKAFLRNGLTALEAQTVTRMFKGRMSMSRLQPGDEIRVLFSSSKKGAQINAVSIKSRRHGRVNAFRNIRDNRYYDDHGLETTSSGKFSRYPIAGPIRITSQFNPYRRHPISGRVRPHNGTDFGVPTGTPVYAPADGVVERATYQSAAGYYIVLKHRGAYSTVYMHLSRILVKPGDKIKANQRIALSGNTGGSTGPHLHYELRINNRPVNAMRVTLPSSTSYSNRDDQKREIFAKQIKTYKRQLGIK